MKPSRSAVIHLALAAVLFRALVPDGFMVARSVEGTPSVVPCPARSAELVQLIQSQSGHHHHHHHGDAGTQAGASAAECPFAASLLTPPPATTPLAVAHLAPAAPTVAPPHALARRALARKPPATGPPSALC